MGSGIKGLQDWIDGVREECSRGVMEQASNPRIPLPERLSTFYPQLRNHLVAVAELEADLGGGVVVACAGGGVVVCGVEYGGGAMLQNGYG